MRPKQPNNSAWIARPVLSEVQRDQLKFALETTNHTPEQFERLVSVIEAAAEAQSLKDKTESQQSISDYKIHLCDALNALNKLGAALDKMTLEDERMIDQYFSIETKSNIAGQGRKLNVYGGSGCAFLVDGMTKAMAAMLDDCTVNGRPKDQRYTYSVSLLANSVTEIFERAKISSNNSSICWRVVKFFLEEFGSPDCGVAETYINQLLHKK